MMIVDLLFLLCLFQFLFMSRGNYLPVDVVNSVVMLDDDTFNSFTSRGANMVNFYSPMCDACQEISGAYFEAAFHFRNSSSLAASSVLYTAIDYSKLPSTSILIQKYNIVELPALLFFKDGKFKFYDRSFENVTSSDFIEWTNLHLKDAVVEVDVNSLTALRSTNDNIVLGLFDSATSENAKIFSLTAFEFNRYYNETFVASYSHGNSEIRDSLGVTGDAVVVLKQSMDVNAFVYTMSKLDSADTANKPSLKNFITGAILPLIQEYSSKKSKQIFKASIEHFGLVFTDKESTHQETTIALYKDIAECYRGRIAFVNVFNREANLIKYFGLVGRELPAFAIVNMSDADALQKFVYPNSSFVTEQVKSYIDHFLGVNLQPTLKSEEVQDADFEGAVVTVKGYSFYDMVINNDDDVFVVFYSPSCEHSRKFAPIWDALGYQYQNKSLVVAKCDATINDIIINENPNFVIDGYPSIYLFKKGAKFEPVFYDDERKLVSMMRFIKFHTEEHSSTSAASECAPSGSATFFQAPSI